MGRRALIVVFVAMSAAMTGEAIAALADAASKATARGWLDVAYAVLKTGVVVAFTVFVARRGPARRRERRPVAFIACTGAMAAVVALQRPDGATATALVVGGEALALVAGAWMLTSTLALGRCFGVLPEARGLVTHGPYRFVRHPLYLGEFGTCAGLVVASPSPVNLALAVVFAASQVARMRMEERELAEQFPEYSAYALRTPRLVPRPWIARQGEAA